MYEEFKKISGLEDKAVFKNGDESIDTESVRRFLAKPEDTIISILCGLKEEILELRNTIESLKNEVDSEKRKDSILINNLNKKIDLLQKQIDEFKKKSIADSNAKTAKELSNEENAPQEEPKYFLNMKSRKIYEVYCDISEDQEVINGATKINSFNGGTEYHSIGNKVTHFYGKLKVSRLEFRNMFWRDFDELEVDEDGIHLKKADKNTDKTTDREKWDYYIEIKGGNIYKVLRNEVTIHELFNGKMRSVKSNTDIEYDSYKYYIFYEGDII